MYITKKPLKFLANFRRQIYSTNKQIYHGINLLIKSVVEFISDVYLVADFWITADLFELVDFSVRFNVVNIFICLSLSNEAVDLQLRTTKIL